MEKTIEERANEYMCGQFKGPRGSYVQGATDQRKIDIEKACEWLKRELAEPMPDEMYLQWCDEKITDFRKAMED